MAARRHGLFSSYRIALISSGIQLVVQSLLSVETNSSVDATHLWMQLTCHQCHVLALLYRGGGGSSILLFEWLAIISETELHKRTISQI